MHPLLLATHVVAINSLGRATFDVVRNRALLLFSVAVFLAGGAGAARGQSALDGFDPNANGVIRAVVVQPDGRILIGGDFTTLSPNGGAAVTRNRIARLNPDGTLDTVFNPNANGNVHAIALQPDGRILAGGEFNGANSIGGQTRNRLARLNGTTGLADSFNPNANFAVLAIAVQPDGKILAGGEFFGSNSIGGQTRNRIARLDANTGLADSFDPNANSSVFTIVLQANGKILAGGLFNGANSIGGQARNRIARLDANTGQADSFDPNANGIVFDIAIQADGEVLMGGAFTTLAPNGGETLTRNRIARLNANTGEADSFNPNSGGSVNAIALQADGKILVGGNFANIGGQIRHDIARLDPITGAVDTFDPNTDNLILTIAVQPDGKILVGGFFTTLSPNAGAAVTRNNIARLEPDGRLDQTLNDLNLVGVQILTIATQPDGKILIGGDFTSVLGSPRNNIARLNTDGTLDTAFNPSANDAVYAIAVQANGQILIGGQFTSVLGSPRNRVARVNINGALDTAFDPNANNDVYSIAVQADGKILAGGAFTSIGGQTRNHIARLDPTNGSADSSFNPNANDEIYSIAVQANGKILAGGDFTTIGGQTRNHLARLSALTGQADSFDPNADDDVLTIAVQSDGKILVGGAFDAIGGQTRHKIARLDATGPNSGMADSFDPDASSLVFSISQQADGKILLSGWFNRLSPNGGPAVTRFGIARVDSGGTPDSFDPAGVSAANVYAAMHADGKILVGGNFTHMGGQARIDFARLIDDTAAMQNVAVTGTAVTWTRDGSSPQLARVTFESSTDNVNYTLLGNGTATGSNWTLTGLSLPNGQNLYIRARGYYSGGVYNGSENIAESLRNVFLGQPPAITSANNTTFTVGTNGNFVVTATGIPAPALSQNGVLPSGVTLNPATGVLSGTPATGAGGNYPLTFRAHNGSGSDAVQNFTLTVNQAPAITSANNTTFAVGSSGNFTVTKTGFPTPTLSRSGALPNGVTFNTATGVLSGPPAAGTGGTYPITFTASNGVGNNAVQNFTLTVNQPPAITSANNTTFTVGANIGFTVTATGNPTPALSESGILPTGVSFNPATGLLSGTAAAGTGGTYPITFTASNGIGSNAVQNFTLTVHQPPAITSGNNTTFTVGTNGTFTVTATGFPAPTLDESGILPSGITFNPETRILGGTPAAGTAGTYLITFIASNGVGSDAMQNFTLTVNQASQAPTITSASETTFTAGSNGDFSVTATGIPPPTLSESGALPSGIMFDPVTGLLSGTPAVGTEGTYPITFTASNGVPPNAVQSFTLFVNGAVGALDGFDPKANGAIRVVVVQPDGKILLGGDFTTLSPNGAATVTRNRMARLNADGTLDPHFSPNANGSVHAIAIQADGKILAGGDFTSIGGQTRSRVARLSALTGQADSFDPNASSTVFAIAVQADGKILTAGDFTAIGGQTRNRIARLDASTGLAQAFDPNANGTVRSIVLHADGRILAGGDFTAIGGQTRNRIARLATTGLADSFDPSANNIVRSIALQADGKVLAGGDFTVIGGQNRNRLARIDHTTGLSDSFDPNANGSVNSVAVQADGRILAGGDFFGANSLGGQARNRIVRLDANTGLADSFDPNANSTVHAIAVQADGKVLVGGLFTTLAPNGATALPRNRIARLETDGRLDQTLNLNLNSAGGGAVFATAVQPDGKILIGGQFTQVLGVPRTNIARLNANGTLDTAFNPSANNQVDAIALQADGRILAGGAFTSIGGQTRNRIARLDAVTGLADSFNPNANNMVHSIAVQADGQILAGGRFTSIGSQTRNRVARLNPTTGLADSFNPSANGFVRSVALQADGKIVVAGDFNGANSIGGQTRNRIARLDASTGLADAFNPNANGTVHSLAVQADGKILAGGFFTGIGGQTRNRMARLDGSTGLADLAFDPNANGLVYSMAVQTDGKILAGGDFTNLGGQARNRFARLNGATGLADSFDPNADSTVFSIAVQADGKVLAGGLFTSIGGQGRSLFARLSTDTAALQNLGGTPTTVVWTRGGSSPLLVRVNFESSTDNVNYAALGTGTAAGSDWTLTGLTLPIGQNFYIRARGYFRSGYQNGSESITESVRNEFIMPLQLTAAVSRKAHGNAGDFDINLLNANFGPECRSSGGSHTLVFTFANTLTSGSASVTAGIGSIAGSPTLAGNTMTVNLTGVADVQKVTVTLSDVTDSFAQVLPATAVSVNMLIGDINGNKSVNTSDIGQVKALSGQTVNAANFKADVAVNGAVNTSDIGLVKSRSGASVP